jgi:hypothetical protein
MMIPVDVITAFVGAPAVDDWDPMYPLLTVDENRYPHVCLLSRAQLTADALHIYAAIASGTTRRNIERTGHAGLIVVRTDAAIQLKLDVHYMESSGDRLLVAFRLSSAKSDQMSVPLEPSRFRVTEALARAEDWARENRLLVQLQRRTHGA